MLLEMYLFKVREKGLSPGAGGLTRLGKHDSAPASDLGFSKSLVIYSQN